MVDAKVDALARSLVQLLNQMVGLHGDLAGLMRGKLEAIKRANAHEMESLTAREMQITERLSEREGLRRQLTERIVGELGLDSADGKRMKLTQLAELFAEPRRSQLLVAAAGLRDRLEQIERMRVTTTLVTQEMVRHLQEVFAVMTAGPADADGYSRTGHRRQSGSATVFEAVG